MASSLGRRCSQSAASASAISSHSAERTWALRRPATAFTDCGIQKYLRFCGSLSADRAEAPAVRHIVRAKEMLDLDSASVGFIGRAARARQIFLLDLLGIELACALAHGLQHVLEPRRFA